MLCRSPHQALQRCTLRCHSRKVEMKPDLWLTPLQSAKLHAALCGFVAGSNRRRHMHIRRQRRARWVSLHSGKVVSLGRQGCGGMPGIALTRLPCYALIVLPVAGASRAASRPLLRTRVPARCTPWGVSRPVSISRAPRPAGCLVCPPAKHCPRLPPTRKVGVAGVPTFAWLLRGVRDVGAHVGKYCQGCLDVCLAAGIWVLPLAGCCLGFLPTNRSHGCLAVTGCLWEVE